MADNENPKIDGFDEVSVGYNYIKLSLSPLAITTAISAELGINAGFTFSVKLSGDYSTKLGPGISSTIWMGGIAAMEYSAEGGTSVKIDGNPITLKTALVKNVGAVGKLHSAGAKIVTAGARLANRISRARARATRVQSSASSNSMGGSVSTGGSH